MAQFVFQDMVNKAGLSDRFHIDSAATSREEIGNPPHHGTVRKMKEVGIPVLPHRAVQMTKKDYENYDYLIGMDSWNIRNILGIIGNGDPEGKVARLLDFTSRAGQDIADPWYTGNFDVTYRDVREGCEGPALSIHWRRNIKTASEKGKPGTDAVLFMPEKPVC